MKHKPYYAVKGYQILNKITDEALAKKLGISIRTLKNKINGSSDFSASEGKLLSEILGVAQDQIFLQ